MCFQGMLTMYDIQSKRVTMRDCTGAERQLQLKDIADDELVKGLLRLNWQYSDMNLKLQIECPVKYREDNAGEVTGVEVRGALRAKAAQELLQDGYIKTGEVRYYGRYLSKDTGRYYASGPAFETNVLVDPGLARFIKANAWRENVWWQDNNLRVCYVLGQGGEVVCVFRHPEEDTKGRLQPYDILAERQVFEQWRDMFLNGTERYSAEAFQKTRSRDQSGDGEMLAAITAEMEKQCNEREGALATDIKDKYWTRLADKEKRDGVWANFKEESPESTNTIAARLLQIALCCYRGDHDSMLKICYTSNMNELGYQLALLMKKPDAAYRFAERRAYEQSGAVPLERLAEITRRSGNYEALYSWLESYLGDIGVEDSADEAGFFMRCYGLLRQLQLQAGIAGDESTELSDEQLERFVAVEGLKQQLKYLSGGIKDPEAQRICRKMDAQCNELGAQILKEPVGIILNLSDVLHEQLTAEVLTWDQLWQNAAGEQINELEAANNRLESIYYTVQEATREAMLNQAEVRAAEPQNAQPVFETVLDRVRERFQEEGGYRVPNERDWDMLPVLEQLLMLEYHDINSYRMPLLVYVTLAEMEKAEEAVLRYQRKVEADIDAARRRRRYNQDRRWNLCQAILDILQGNAADMGAAKPTENERAFIAKLQRRYQN